jgi:hypothetical protein
MWHPSPPLRRKPQAAQAFLQAADIGEEFRPAAEPGPYEMFLSGGEGTLLPLPNKQGFRSGVMQGFEPTGNLLNHIFPRFTDKAKGEVQLLLAGDADIVRRTFKNPLRRGQGIYKLFRQSAGDKQPHPQHSDQGPLMPSRR